MVSWKPKLMADGDREISESIKALRTLNVFAKTEAYL